MTQSRETLYFEPENGWFLFSDSIVVVDVIWENLSEEDGVWKYMNLTTDTSIWEYQADGSYIWIGFDLTPTEKITEIYATRGYAADYLQQCLSKFDFRKNWVKNL